MLSVIFLLLNIHKLSLYNGLSSYVLIYGLNVADLKMLDG